MTKIDKLRQMVRDGQTSPALVEVVEMLEAVIYEVERQNDKEYLDSLGWQLVNCKGESNSASLVRCIGSHIVHKRVGTDWTVAK